MVHSVVSILVPAMCMRPPPPLMYLHCQYPGRDPSNAMRMSPPPRPLLRYGTCMASILAVTLPMPVDAPVITATGLSGEEDDEAEAELLLKATILGSGRRGLLAKEHGLHGRWLRSLRVLQHGEKLLFRWATDVVIGVLSGCDESKDTTVCVAVRPVWDISV